MGPCKLGKRASDLSLCNRCLSDRHKTSECPGIRASLPYKCFNCSKSEHHGAMCPQSLSISSKNILNCQSGSEIFVPVLSLKVSKGKKSFKCSFLLDTGAQFSIINKQIIDSKLGDCCGAPLTRLVSSFGVPAGASKGYNFLANLTLPCGGKTRCLFFAKEGFKLSLQIPMLPSVVKNLELAGYSVSPNYPGRNTECIEILGILGNDILQDFTLFDLVDVELFKFSIKVIKLANGSIPFGSVENFIHPSERKSFLQRVSESLKPCGSDSQVATSSLVDISKVSVKLNNSSEVSNSKLVKFASEVNEPLKDNFSKFQVPSRVFL